MMKLFKLMFVVVILLVQGQCWGMRAEDIAPVIVQPEKADSIKAEALKIAILKALERADLETVSSLIESTKFRAGTAIIKAKTVADTIRAKKYGSVLAEIAKAKKHQFTLEFLRKRVLYPKTRLIVDNRAENWRGRYSLWIKWGMRMPDGTLARFEQVLEYGEKLFIGEIKDILYVRLKSYGTLEQHINTGWVELKPEIDIAQLAYSASMDERLEVNANQPKLDIVLKIQTTVTSFSAKVEFTPEPEAAGLRVGGRFTGRVIDAFPIARQRAEERKPHEARSYLALPPGASKDVIKNVYRLTMANWENFRKTHPEQEKFINAVQQELKSAYEELMQKAGS